ncbi:hypothetical protein [Lysinibacillus sp. BW-2-10]|uniref:hypothetical protein n=1 Tax=Lysinibacillus sp. BW-2-10 TaxID=2590030 RepID=UPI00117C49F2|nr:hypothetical protein [Lysinibacillus sp. BW-2-10]TSI10551.1 hypothetical protein FJQ64_03730 [Lysinibacillus sp. BW-2-10]
MGKTSIGKILEELRENQKLKNYAPRTLNDYYVKLITRGAKNKEEIEEIKKQYKNRNGHYEIDEYLKPFFSAIFQGYDRGLTFYTKILGNSEELSYQEIQESNKAAVKVFIEECIDDEHIQSMVYKFDEFASVSLSILFENINRYLNAILLNTYELEYIDRVSILKNVENVFKKSIFPNSIQSILLSSLGNELIKMGASPEELEKEFLKVLKNQSYQGPAKND